MDDTLDSNRVYYDYQPNMSLPFYYLFLDGQNTVFDKRNLDQTNEQGPNS